MHIETAKHLLVAYLVVGVGALLAAALTHEQNTSVWVRGAIVVAAGALDLAFARRAANGSRGALRRLRIVSPIVLAGIVAIVALPDGFPLWFKLEQAASGVLMLGVVLAVARRQPSVNGSRVSPVSSTQTDLFSR